MKTLIKTLAASASLATIASTAEAQSTERVTFISGGQTVVGNLYLPEDYNPQAHYPAVVVGGSLTAVKEMMSATYAEKLAEQGIMALAIDYRNYGESGGNIRQFEDPALKSEDLSSAVTYLLERSDTKAGGIGLLGVCTSGGTVLYAAADDNRISSVATVAGWFAEPSLAPHDVWRQRCR